MRGLALLLAFVLAWPAGAASLRIASGNDPQSFDPHAIALLYQSRVLTQVYESLVNRDREFKLESEYTLLALQVDVSWQDGVGSKIYTVRSMRSVLAEELEDR